MPNTTSGILPTPKLPLSSEAMELFNSLRPSDAYMRQLCLITIQQLYISLGNTSSEVYINVTS